MDVPPNPELAAAIRAVKLPPGDLNNARRLQRILLETADNGREDGRDQQYLDDLHSATALSVMELLALVGQLYERLG